MKEIPCSLSFELPDFQLSNAYEDQKRPFMVKSENKRTLWKTQNTSPPLARFVTSPFHNV
ncbi:MAG: hypothetical protein OXN27_21065 [Candidatus Poribacteria bacterium]|nr:hypothetical protein [Candidatus Poribacteria bacterium]MDE0326423.1 hypothetical protein [Candidatus Poribacteria bacterium]